ncbi:MAG: hypothetical protein WAT93_09900 [Pontixanthobacter sp.]
MEFAVVLILAFVPPLLLLLVPRKMVAVVSVLTAVMALLAVWWSWNLNDNCASDGCIGAGIASGFTALFVVLSVIAGGIRWAIIHYQNRRDGGWGF